MSGNSAFQSITEQGWRAGLNNLLRAETRRWWKTRTWWVQSLIWVGVVDLILFMVISAGRGPEGELMPPEELILLYGIFGGMFTAVGVVIHMQGAIVGEKVSGTAAWVLSKPISRSAFVLSKMLGNTLGIVVTAILIPGILAYLIITQGTGAAISIPNFVGGMGILSLFALYWLSFTLMLGAFFSARGPVIGIALGMILGQQFIMGIATNISPKLLDFLPYQLTIPPQGEGGVSVVGQIILGIPLTTWAPVYSSVIAIVIFILLGIWRFRREEF